MIVGTRAAESLEFVTELAEAFGSERVAVGIDAKNGWVSVKGWTEVSGMKAGTLAVKAEEAGAGTIICTDIATDGMLTGPNYGEIEQVMTLVRCNVIASGGVSSSEDVLRLAGMRGLYGAIIGKALYDDRIKLEELARRVRGRGNC